MAHSFLLFDFGTDEEAAQRARHAVERWRQGFRLGKKLLTKFQREEPGESDSKGAQIRMIVRLDFSEHERLSETRWLERIPGEEHFKAAHSTVVRRGDPAFPDTEAKFDALD